VVSLFQGFSRGRLWFSNRGISTRFSRMKRFWGTIVSEIEINLKI